MRQINKEEIEPIKIALQIVGIDLTYVQIALFIDIYEMKKKRGKQFDMHDVLKIERQITGENKRKRVIVERLCDYVVAC